VKKRELEAIHQLSKNSYVCIDDQCSMISQYDQLDGLLEVLDLGKANLNCFNRLASLFWRAAAVGCLNLAS
jgi:hypothetical protein